MCPFTGDFSAMYVPTGYRQVALEASAQVHLLRTRVTVLKSNPVLEPRGVDLGASIILGLERRSDSSRRRDFLPYGVPAVGFVDHVVLCLKQWVTSPPLHRNDVQ